MNPIETIPSGKCFCFFLFFFQIKNQQMHGCRVREIWIVTECLSGVSSHFWFCFCFFSTFKSTKDFHKALLRSRWNLNSYTIFIACLLSPFGFLLYICCVGFTTKRRQNIFSLKRRLIIVWEKKIIPSVGLHSLF